MSTAEIMKKRRQRKHKVAAWSKFPVHIKQRAVRVAHRENRSFSNLVLFAVEELLRSKGQHPEQDT